MLGLTLTRLVRILGNARRSLIPEDAGVPRHQKLQQNWYISLQLITAKAVLQLSVKKTYQSSHTHRPLKEYKGPYDFQNAENTVRITESSYKNDIYFITPDFQIIWLCT